MLTTKNLTKDVKQKISGKEKVGAAGGQSDKDYKVMSCWIDNPLLGGTENGPSAGN